MTDYPTAARVMPPPAVPDQPRRSDENAALACALSALLVGAVTAVDLGLVWWLWDRALDLNEWLVTAITTIPNVLFALVVLVRGRQLWRGLVAALIAAVAVVVDATMWIVVTLDSQQVLDWLGAEGFQRLSDVTAYLATGLTVLAWGVARRRGLLWLLGLVSVAPLVWLTLRYVEHLYREAAELTVGIGLSAAVASIAAVLAAAVICWLLDLLQRLIWPASASVSTA